MYESEEKIYLQHRYHNSRIFEERTVPPVDIPIEVFRHLLNL